MAIYAAALPKREEYRVSGARRLLILIALVGSFLVTALVTTSMLLPDYPLAWAGAIGLLAWLWFRLFRDIPGGKARLIMDSNGITCSEWPFGSLSWRDLREIELFGGAEGSPSRILLKLNKHYSPSLDEKMRAKLQPAEIPEVVEIVADAYSPDVWTLHERIATWLAHHNPASYPAMRQSRGLSASGLRSG